MTTTLTEPELTRERALWHAEWLVMFGSGAVDAGRQGARLWRSADTFVSLIGAEGSDVRVAEDSRFVVLFSGLLTNIRELDALAGQNEAARIVLDRLRGSDVAFAALRGPFTAIVWDRREGKLLVARDHIGLEPIFFARCAPTAWLFSPSPDVLASQAGVSRDANAVAISEWLCGWFPAVEDTAYRDVKRVPPGSVVSFPGEKVERYWDPFDERFPTKWLKESELGEFEPLLRKAVKRSSHGMPAAIFLSGGVDSIAVALTATEVTRERPLALSLVFPDERSSEETIQAGVAKQLGIEQVLLPFRDAVGPQGLLAEALRVSRSWPQPMWNIWSPAYMALAREAHARDRKVILTGRGGDEWLTISPYLLADQLRHGDFRGMHRLLQMRRRSNNLAGIGAAARLVWTTACRPLAGAAFDAMAPRLWHERRRRRLLTERPDWIAPDPAVRRAMEDRLDRWIDPARPAGGFYHREGRTALRHPAVTHDMEETQEFGRRHGARVLHPFWDVDLIEMLHRVPPPLLMSDGRSKSLLRRRLGDRFPGLGLERRGKMSAGHIFRGVMRQEGPEALRQIGGLKTLSAIGAVRAADIQYSAPQIDLAAAVGNAGRLWTLLNLESWARHRT
jgi:asparagine synthetase B (glutamine-hydrolysing)